MCFGGIDGPTFGNCSGYPLLEVGRGTGGLASASEPRHPGDLGGRGLGWQLLAFAEPPVLLRTGTPPGRGHRPIALLAVALEGDQTARRRRFPARFHR